MSVIARVGLNTDVFPESEDPAVRRRCGVWLEYVDVLVELGLAPVILPPTERALDLVDDLDGILLIGGDDYRAGNASEPLEEFVPVDRRREAFDLALSRRSLADDVPLLAICAGFQAIALVGGGTIHEDLPRQHPSSVLHKRTSPEDPTPTHDVAWEGSAERSLAIDSGRYPINSHHHQAVATLPPNWDAVGLAPDGVIEAAVGPGTFQVGVQWHPERDSGELSRTILARFAGAAKRHAAERQPAERR